MKKMILIFIAGILMFSSCVKESGEGEFNEAPPLNNSSEQTGDKVLQEKKLEYIKVNGNVIAENSVGIHPEIGGKLVKTFVLLGSKVRKGDAIAEINPSEAGDRYNNYIVRSPISGVVTSIPLKAGSAVTTDTVAAIVSDVSRLRICCDVSERYAAFLKKGLRAEASLIAYPDEVFAASVESYSPVIDEIKRTKQVFLDFDKRDARIEAGMFAKIKLFIEE